MPNGYLVARQLDDVIALPLLLPVTRLEAASQIILGVVQLSGDYQRLKHRWAQVKIIARDPEIPAVPELVNPLYGYAYGAIYDSEGTLLAGSVTNCASPSLLPPLLGVGLSQEFVAVGPAAPLKTEYTYRLVNNCASTALNVLVCGAWRVVLNELTA